MTISDRDKKVLDRIQHIAEELFFVKKHLPDTELLLYVGNDEFHSITSIDRADRTAPIQDMDSQFFWFNCQMIRVNKQSYLHIARKETLE